MEPNSREFYKQCSFQKYCNAVLHNEACDAHRELRTHKAKGDPDAMKMVLQHFSGYIARLSMRKLYDERGNVYFGIDNDIRERLQAKLMMAVLNFRTEK